MRIRGSPVIPTLLLALAHCSCDTGTENADATAVSYKVYERSYYIGPRGQTDTAFFYHTTGKAAFDALFQYLNENPPVDTIPRSDSPPRVRSQW
jgi:hypothetical protein